MDSSSIFNGIALWRPWTYKRTWKTNEGPSCLHIDQHPIGRPGKHCVQGLVNLLPTSLQTKGNVMVPDSHRRFEAIPEMYKERLERIHPSIDHFRFPNDDPLLADAEPVICHMDPVILCFGIQEPFTAAALVWELQILMTASLELPASSA